MSYYHNFTNDPQQNWDEPEEDNENCPHCGSDRSEPSHFDFNTGTDWVRCLDCDTIYEIF